MLLCGFHLVLSPHIHSLRKKKSADSRICARILWRRGRQEAGEAGETQEFSESETGCCTRALVCTLITLLHAERVLRLSSLGSAVSAALAYRAVRDEPGLDALVRSFLFAESALDNVLEPTKGMLHTWPLQERTEPTLA